MRHILFVVIWLTPPFAYSYNHSKCMYWKSRGNRGIVGLSLSSSSFFSSTGDCAMIGSVEERKLQFLVFNEEILRNDSARGKGEALSAYSKLLGCNFSGNKALGALLQKEYIDVFSGDSDHIYKKIEALKNSSPALKTNCKNKV